MAALLKNVTLVTKRSIYSAATGVTSAATKTTSPQVTAKAHLEPEGKPELTARNDQVTGRYLAFVDSGTDIAQGDIVVTITPLRAGAWTNPLPQSPGAFWIVSQAQEDMIGLLPYRRLILEFVSSAGPTHQ